MGGVASAAPPCTPPGKCPVVEMSVLLSFLALQACDAHLCAAVNGGWPEWLVLADAGMPRLLRKAAAEVVRQLLSSPAEAKKQMLSQVAGMSANTCTMLLEAVLQAATRRGVSTAQSLAGYIPDLSDWTSPGDALR